MAEHTYHLHPLAEQEIVDYKAELKRCHEAGLIDREQASRLLQERIAHLMIVARVESSDSRMIDVACTDCYQTHRMRADVIEYRCKCDPNRVRMALGDQASPDGAVREPLTVTSLRDRSVSPLL